MATVKVSTMISHFSSVKMLVFALMLSFILAVVVHLSIRDFKAVSSSARTWTPGYGPDLPKVPHLPKTGILGKSTQLGLKLPHGRQQRLPGCIIVGFANGGATALRELLSVHPGLAATRNEVKFFTENYQKGQSWYRQQMPLSFPSQITVEGTQTYIRSPEALTRIFRFNANIKLIAVVQDPVNRLLSAYIKEMSVLEPRDQLTFKEWCGFIYNAPKVLRYINYEAPIQEVYRHFPAKNLLVLSKEDVELRPFQTLKAVEKFLGLQPGLSPDEFVENTDRGGTCFNKNGLRYPLIREMMTAQKVLDLDTGCLVYDGNMPYVPGVRADPDFFQKVVGVAQKTNVRLFQLIGKTFDWTTNFKLAQAKRKT
ncbi:hypothetical protein EGW08_006646 [Elysia chlorotica]|uniref:Sulfotransferase domain-containing protein n=1 Tax=Elysia chlorotica TaxID=188477 RepID=A0A433TVH5_ELYCH|nr:hypothetical protein EGW08_006646 [Elysia chlorotica]